MARIARISDERVRALDSGWEMAELDADAAADPQALERISVRWLPASVPGTAARALSLAGVTVREDLDAKDYWFRTRFVAPSGAWSLRFGGLATLCDVWLDGSHLFFGDNMFVAEERDAGDVRAREVQLMLRFRSLGALLRERRGRARFRTRLVKESGLRNVRTTLFGRMPGFSPLIAAVGPWRAIEIVERGLLSVVHADVHARLLDDAGVVEARVLLGAPSRELTGATLRVGNVSAPLFIAREAGALVVSGEAHLPAVERWWPHTHGPQPLYPVSIELQLGSRRVELDFGRTGFRSLDVATEGGGFALCMNGARVFCRGACWLPVDLLSVDAAPADLEETLRLVRAGGMNMLRVAAQGVYETDTFFDRCAELGILVWHDFMFSRMDYPNDPRFVAGVEKEARQFVARTQLAPSLVVLCGNSEVAQQAAMLGLDPELGRSPLFEATLPGVCSELRDDVPYLPSTPSGGALPFHVDAGVAHYFGVGAYLRPLSDARLANVRFASECLAFSNVPDEALIARAFGGDASVCGPEWKAAIMRDNGASWDFEDVREHYLEELFHVRSRDLRTLDSARWLELGRLATAEAMFATIAEFRRVGSGCAGALIWHLRDLLPGAGCGLLDAGGRPKAAFWYVARAFRPVALFLIDEGLNGLRAHAINETARARAAELTVSFYRRGKRVDRASTSLALPAGAAVELSIDAMLGRFVDSTRAYRFGADGHDVAVGVLGDVLSGEVLAEAYHFPLGIPAERSAELVLTARATEHEIGYALVLEANTVAYAVHVEAEGFVPEDDYFHLEPGRARTLVLKARSAPERPLSARITALNGRAAISLRVERDEAAESA